MELIDDEQDRSMKYFDCKKQIYQRYGFLIWYRVSIANSKDAPGLFQKTLDDLSSHCDESSLYPHRRDVVKQLSSLEFGDLNSDHLFPLSISENEKETLVYRYCFGLPYEEIGALLGINAKQAKRLCRQAKNNLFISRIGYYRQIRQIMIPIADNIERTIPAFDGLVLKSMAIRRHPRWISLSVIIGAVVVCLSILLILIGSGAFGFNR